MARPSIQAVICCHQERHRWATVVLFASASLSLPSATDGAAQRPGCHMLSSGAPPLGDRRAFCLSIPITAICHRWHGPASRLSYAVITSATVGRPSCFLPQHPYHCHLPPMARPSVQAAICCHQERHRAHVFMSANDEGSAFFYGSRRNQAARRDILDMASASAPAPRVFTSAGCCA